MGFLGSIFSPGNLDWPATGSADRKPKCSIWHPHLHVPVEYCFLRLKMTNEEMAIGLTNHDDRLKVVEQGVSNFRKFQTKMDRRMGFVYGATWVGGIFGVVALAIFSWLLSLVVPAAKVIMDDYYRNHPAAIIQKSEIDTYVANQNSIPKTAKNGDEQ
jgi:hypothetical protein